MSESKSILLVEDEALIAMSEASMLRKAGYKVTVAHSGEQAIDIVQAGPQAINLILMDINMEPGMDGTQAAQEILKTHNIPIIFLSSHTEPEVVAKTEKITSYGYVVKNSGITVLTASIKMAFKLHAAHQALQDTNLKLSLAQEASRAGTWDWDTTSGAFDWSPEFYKILGLSPGAKASPEILAQVIHPQDRELFAASMREAVEKQTELFCDFRVILPSPATPSSLPPPPSLYEASASSAGEGAGGEGPIRWMRATGKPYLTATQSLRITGLCMDITERKRAEEMLALEAVRLQTQLELHKQMGSSQKELLDFSLEALTRTTQSQFAFIGLIDPQETVMTIHSWSRGAMAQCAVETTPIHFPIAEAGLWGECVRQRRPVMVNDYASSPYRRGTPPGHVPIQRFLAVPVFDNERIVAVAAVANKVENDEPAASYEAAASYTESDCSALAVLTERIWMVLQRKQAEEALQARTHELHERVKELNCLLSLSNLVETCGDQVEKILQEVPYLIPPAWRYPESACARIMVADQEFRTDNFRATPWHLVSQIHVRGQCVGTVEVGYLQAPPSGDADPFLKEERMLIQAIAERLGRVIERMRSEAEREKVIQMLTDTLESISDGFFSLDDQWRITYFNQKAERLLGRGRQEVLGQKLFDAFPEARGSVFDQQYSRAMREKQSLTFETYFNTPPYTNWYDVHVYPQANGISVYFQVITGRKQAEEALRASTERFLSLAAVVPGYLALINADTLQYEFVNSMFEKSYALPRDTIIGRHIQDVLGEANFQFALKYLDEVRSGRPVSYENVFNLVPGRRWLKVHYAPLLAAGGRVASIVVLGYDVTEQKQMEEALRESEKLYRTLVEMADDVIILTDLQGAHLFRNSAYYSSLGFEEGDAVDLEGFARVHPDDLPLVRAGMTELFEKGRSSAEYRVQHKNGSWIYRYNKASLIRDARGHPQAILSVIRDITGRRQAEEALRRSVQEKEILLQELQHRVKNSLMVAAGLLNLEQDRLPDNRTRAIFASTQARLHSMSIVYEQLYRGSQIQRVDLRQYIEDLVEALSQSYLLESAPLRIETDLAQVDLDLQRTLPLGIIVNELVTNALKYAFPPERIRSGAPGIIRVTLSRNSNSAEIPMPSLLPLAEEEPGLRVPTAGEVKLCVEDNGVGLPESASLPDHSAPDHGLGLGLVKMLTRQINGSFTLDGSHGCTATITFDEEG